MVLPMITKYIIILCDKTKTVADTQFLLFGWSPKSKEQLFLLLAISWLGIVIIRQGLAYLRSFLMVKSSTLAVNRMECDVFNRLLWQSQTFIRSENTGNILTVINGDTALVKNFITGTVPGIIESLLAFVFASVMIWQMSPYLVLAAYLFVIPLYIMSKRMGRIFYKWYHFVRDSSAELSMVTQENINGIRIVKAYAQEEQEKKKFAKKNEAFRYHAINYMVIYCKEYIPSTIIAHLPNLTLTFLCALFVLLANRGETAPSLTMSVAEFVAIAGYVGYVIAPFSNASSWLNAAQQAITSADKVFRFLNIGSTIASKPNAQDIDTSNVHLTFENVTFTSESKTVLKNINIDLPQGKTLGVMGATGSGKSILSQVMARFYDPTEGSVKINGIDVKDLKLETVRKCYSPVMQDVFLFSDTIGKNIAFGKPDATYEDVIKAAKVAQAHDFISKTPDEYDTIVGERGMGLSGGQKQRISIARALLYNAPIIVFDDATSALDMETEQELYKALKKDHSHQSRVIIAHRISSVKDCDEIIMLDHGEIIERGTHDELVALKGRYYEIYREQYSTVLEAL
jgi:ATP-binding cassette subfamily B protein